jgi:hypothetical protein
MGTVTALVIGFAAPAMAQQPMRHYLAPSGEYDGFAVFEFPDDVTAGDQREEIGVMRDS